MDEFEKRLASIIRAAATTVRGYMIDSCKFGGINKYDQLANAAARRSHDRFRWNRRHTRYPIGELGVIVSKRLFPGLTESCHFFYHVQEQ